MKESILLLSLFLFGSLAISRVPIISRSRIPHGWIEVGEAHPQQTVHFSILLQQNNLQELEDLFEKVSNPRSPFWGKFLKPDQIDAITKADKDSFDAVNEWLSPIKQFSHFTYLSDSIRVTTTANGVKILFNTPMSVYKHKATGKLVVKVPRTATIPAHLNEHIQLIVGLSEFLTDKVKSFPTIPGTESATVLKSRKPYSGVGGQDILITPTVLKQYYNVPSNLVGSSKTTQGIAAFTDYFSLGALQAFDKDQGLSDPQVKRLGPDCLLENPPCDQYESDLDIQYVTAMGTGVSTIFLNQPQDYWILKFAEDALKLSPLPTVFSLSYGFSELAQCYVAVANCDQFGYNTYIYVNRTNIALQKLGVAGISVLVSDGDDGAPNLGASDGNCPIDLSHWCPLGGCQDSNPKCGAFIAVNTTSKERCNFPMGIGSFACSDFLGDPNVDKIINDFASANQNCNFNIDTDSSQMPHFYSSCSCNTLQEVVSNGWEIQGYYEDPAQGSAFTADYPTSSPYVTSVGATQFLADNSGRITEEVVCSILTGAIITTGGGFSSFQPMPDYQKNIVNNYLQQNQGVLPPRYTYNPIMRAYPDISFNGHHYKIFYSNDSSDNCPCPWTAVDGTSCSAPALSGLISLINDQLIQNNKSPLGFLNYLLYQMYDDARSAFNDITSGSNNCNRAYCCKYGYQAVPGWDPSSGLGSPNFQVMNQYILNKKGVKTQ